MFTEELWAAKVEVKRILGASNSSSSFILVAPGNVLFHRTHDGAHDLARLLSAKAAQWSRQLR